MTFLVSLFCGILLGLMIKALYLIRIREPQAIDGTYGTC